MAADQVIEAALFFVLLAQFAAVLGTLPRRGVGSIALCNAVFAIGGGVLLLGALARGPGEWAEGLYPAMMGLLLFELATLATSIGWARLRENWLGQLAIVEFAPHVLTTLAALLFMFTFQVKLEL